ncbi:hypothetical protein G5B41_14045 [bacterium SGD-2]|nr:hypothetical protein [bacterium SGD-2]
MSEHFTGQIAVRPSPAQYGLEILQRAVALLCLVQGVLYWTRLIGLYPSEEWRFDLLPAYWRIAAGSLAVLFPFASVGLWTLASWGPVIWFVCAASETVMFTFMSDLFGFRPWVVAGHLLTAACYVALRIAIHREEKKQEQE